mgnify:CR=1 FL=1
MNEEIRINYDAIRPSDCVDMQRFKDQEVVLHNGKVEGFVPVEKPSEGEAS